jgi:hypothetical protein
VPAPQFTLNALAPLFFNSNPEFRSSGGPQSLEASPVARPGVGDQVGALPLRFSGAAGLEFERFPNANDANIDYLRTSARLQYTPGGPQGFSPFFSYVPLCRGWTSTRPCRTILRHAQRLHDGLLSQRQHADACRRRDGRCGAGSGRRPNRHGGGIAVPARRSPLALAEGLPQMRRAAPPIGQATNG